MGERRVARRIVLHVRRLVAGQRRFYIDQGAGRGVGVDLIITDGADGVMAVAGLDAGRSLDLLEVEVDVDAQVDADLANGVAEILEGEMRVAACIHYEDAVAAA